jgi:hypothetical protein
MAARLSGQQNSGSQEPLQEPILIGNQAPRQASHVLQTQATLRFPRPDFSAKVLGGC